MVDIHAHILPGVDDGPPEWDKALKMLGRAAQDGVARIVATPHVLPGGYDNPKEKVSALVEELRERARNIPIEVLPGSEVSVCPEALKWVEGGRCLTLNRSRYLLVELPAQFIPAHVYDFMFALTSRRYVPVLAHPERNPKLREDVEVVYELARLGTLMQVTAGSLTGLFGADAKRFAAEMFSRRLAHVMASDAHSHGRRPPVLSEGLKEASRLIGDRAALAMVRETPEAMLANRHFEPEEPVHIKKKRFIFF